MLLQLIAVSPDLLFISSSFPLAFRASMAGLTVVHTEILFATLTLFRDIFTHDSLVLAEGTSQPPNFQIYAGGIRDVFDKEGFIFVGYILNGLAGDFPEDAISYVVSIFRVIAYTWPSQLLAWLPSILEQLPTAAAPVQAKAHFLGEVTRCVLKIHHKHTFGVKDDI